MTRRRRPATAVTPRTAARRVTPARSAKTAAITSHNMLPRAAVVTTINHRRGARPDGTPPSGSTAASRRLNHSAPITTLASLPDPAMTHPPRSSW
jgi:hypothetical protein